MLFHRIVGNKVATCSDFSNLLACSTDQGDPGSDSERIGTNVTQDNPKVMVAVTDIIAKQMNSIAIGHYQNVEVTIQVIIEATHATTLACYAPIALVPIAGRGTENQ